MKAVFQIKVWTDVKLLIQDVADTFTEEKPPKPSEERNHKKGTRWMRNVAAHLSDALMHISSVKVEMI